MGGNDSCAKRFFDAIGAGIVTGSTLGAVQVAWEQAPSTKAPRTVTLAQAVKRVKFNAGLFATIGVAYVVTECAMETFIGRRSVQGSIAGGVASGAVLGIAGKSYPLGATAALGLGSVMGLLEYNGGVFTNRGDREWGRILGHGQKSEE